MCTTTETSDETLHITAQVFTFQPASALFIYWIITVPSYQAWQTSAVSNISVFNPIMNMI